MTSNTGFVRVIANHYMASHPLFSETVPREIQLQTDEAQLLTLLETESKEKQLCADEIQQDIVKLESVLIKLGNDSKKAMRTYIDDQLIFLREANEEAQEIQDCINAIKRIEKRIEKVKGVKRENQGIVEKWV